MGIDPVVGVTAGVFLVHQSSGDEAYSRQTPPPPELVTLCRHSGQSNYCVQGNVGDPGVCGTWVLPSQDTGHCRRQGTLESGGTNLVQAYHSSIWETEAGGLGI